MQKVKLVDNVSGSESRLPKTSMSMPVLMKLLSSEELESLTKKYTHFYGGGGGRRARNSKWLSLPVLDEETAIFKEWRDGNISITEARRKIAVIYHLTPGAVGASYASTLRLLATATSLTQ